MGTTHAAFVGNTLVGSELGILRLDQLAAISSIPGHPEVEVGGSRGPLLARCSARQARTRLRRVTTETGFSLTGVPGLAVMAIDPRSGVPLWTTLGALPPGVVVPMRFGRLIGPTRPIPLPIVSQAYYTETRDVRAPREFNAELAELVGYFMGDGSLHAKGLRFCVAEADEDVRDRLVGLVEELFGVQPLLYERQGYCEVAACSTRLADWWQVTGLSKHRPNPEHRGKGWTPHVPAALRETNNPRFYAAFLAGLFEADGSVAEGVPSLSTASPEFAHEIRSMLALLGVLTTTRETVSGFGGPIFQIRLRNLCYVDRYAQRIGFLGARKAGLLRLGGPTLVGKRDRIYLPRQTWDALVPKDHACRGLVIQALRRSGSVPRDVVARIQAEQHDPRLTDALDGFFEVIGDIADERAQPVCMVKTTGRSPYVAGGFLVR